MRRRLGYALGVITLTFGLVGCRAGAPDSKQPIGRLNIGTVDVMRVMEEKPETVQIRLDWAQQAGKTYTDLTRVGNDPEKYAQLQRQIAKQSEDWQKRMDTFMERSIAEVEVEAQKEAQAKRLDIVLVDNPLTKILKYHDGVDLTTDILFALQSHRGK